MNKISSVLDDTIRLLTIHGYRVQRIVYPEDHNKRSIDVVASHEERKPLMIKVVNDTSDLRPGELSELRDCSNILGAAGLVVANNDNGEEIDDIVAHEKSGIFIVGVGGLRSTLGNSIYVVKRQGNYYMRVDGEKLRAERERKGYGLGDLAALLSVSRRAVYMYEREETDVSLQTALRLMEVFGDRVFRPINILEEEEKNRHIPKQRRYISSRLERLLSAIKDLGGELVETKRAPSDAVARVDKEKMVIVLSASKEKILLKKVSESAKVASSVNAKIVAIIRQASRQTIEEEVSDTELLDIYRSVDEFVNEIKYEKR